MRHRGAVAFMPDRPLDDPRARNEAVQERMRCTARLQPVDMPQILQWDFRTPPSVPFTVNADQRVVRLHEASWPRRSSVLPLLHRKQPDRKIGYEREVSGV